jgi:hypothetical protein
VDDVVTMIIDVEDQVCRVMPRVKHKQGCVGDGGDKSHGGDVGCKALVPSARILL